jgi:hypothetical protein
VVIPVTVADLSEKLKPKKSAKKRPQKSPRSSARVPTYKQLKITNIQTEATDSIVLSPAKTAAPPVDGQLPTSPGKRKKNKSK